METITNPEQMRAWCRERRSRGGQLALVPTMGALHEGHLSLVRLARKHADLVAVSLFVNPLQFGPAEDYGRYPRTLERDRELLERERVDVLFAPAPQQMYPQGSATYVVVEGLSEKLCGRFRPGHFRGVTTVVAKLFNITEPDVAVFGQKDAAQVAIVRRMVRDLNFGLEIVVGPTVREADGLALSSRNRYLDPQQRRSAAVLFRALGRVQELVDRGEHCSQALIAEGTRVIAGDSAVKLEYFEVVDPDTLDAVEEVSRGALVAVAAHLGSTRLIDNILLEAKA